MRPTGDAWDTTLDTSEAEVRVAKMSASLWAPRRTGGDGCLSRTVHTGFASARHLKMQMGLMKARLVLIAALSALAIGSWATHRKTPSPQGSADAPTPFELTRMGDDRVSMHLHGGTVERPQPRKPSAERTGLVRGRVVDGQGQPVSDVVVIGGDLLGVMYDVMGGRGGALTDADGRFSLDTFVRQEATVLAAHHEYGMSRAVITRAGEEVELRLEPFARLEGFVRTGDDAVECNVVATSSSHGTVIYNTQTDASGHYALGPLPPGDYEVLAFWPQDVEGTIVFPRPTVELAPGVTTTQNLESGPGSLRVEYHRPPGFPVSDAAVRLFEGRPNVKTHAQFERVTEFAHSTIRSREDATTFHGVPYGTYTACARSNMGEEGMHVECEPVEIRGPEAAVVDLSLHAG